MVYKHSFGLKPDPPKQFLLFNCYFILFSQFYLHDEVWKFNPDVIFFLQFFNSYWDTTGNKNVQKSPLGKLHAAFSINT